jgi:two-component system, NtrC family, sensor kinase
MPSEASVVSGDQSMEQLRRDLTDARKQYAAVAEILHVIAGAPADVQPVFDAIVTNAARLCDAALSAVVMFEGGQLQLVAVNKMSREEVAAYHTLFPRSPGRHFVMGRAFVDRQPVHVADIEADPDYDPHTIATLKAAAPYCTVLGIPILRDGVAIGAIGCLRREVKPFTEAQIALVNSFADQAVIAIENTRLFEAEQVSKRELQESLEYQTAISDVLGVISRSPTNLQPVFDTIAQSAAQLCEAQFCHVCRFDGKLIHFGAAHGLTPEGRHALQSGYPLAPGRATATARSILTGSVEEIPDVHTDPEYAHGGAATVMNLRSVVAVPMLKDNHPIGAIGIARSTTGRFSTRQISLLKTFADQAVIAIENTRLFEAEQASKRALTEALEQQTATSEVLSIISSSPGELEAVFEAMLANARRLCEASCGNMFLCEGDAFRIAAINGDLPAAYMRQWPRGTLLPARPRSPHRSRRPNSEARPCGRPARRSGLPQRRSIASCDSRDCRRSDVVRRADAQRERIGRCDRHLPPRGAAIHRQAD